MKRFLLAALVAAFGFSGASARTLERVYAATDRAVYVAGDYVWCSVFCFDALNGGGLSDFSSIAYLELISPAGRVGTCKIALEGGRGAGRFRIPNDAPTGNYRLLSYTALNRNETGFDYLETSRVISVFNTLSTERVDGCVVVADQAPASAAGDLSGAVSAELGGDGMLRLVNNSDEAVSVAVAVGLTDNIPDPERDDIRRFAGRYAGGVECPAFTSERIPEYDGEVIRLRLPASCAGSTAFISSPGNASNVYSSQVAEDGTVTFFTSNIYGDMDMVFEVFSDSQDGSYAVEVDSPFANPAVGPNQVPALTVSPSYAEALLRRSVAMQIDDKFGVEVLTDFLPERPNLLYEKDLMVSYILDDYTRFATMRETIFEFVKELHIRKSGGRNTISVDLKGGMGSSGPLMLIDGVPVSDHQRLIDYDPALVKRIDIYPYPVVTGSQIVGGIANFVTFRGDMPKMDFPRSATMLDFHGTSYPVALTGRRIDDSYPDLRTTLLWQPLVSLGPGESAEFECPLPSGSSGVVISAEGLTASGSPVFVREYRK